MLENVDRIMGRMRQIEARMSSNPVNSEAFQRFMADEMRQRGLRASLGSDHSASLKLDHLSNMQLISMMQHPSGSNGWFGPVTNATDKLIPLAQNNSVSCGQTSVAMCINALTGKNLRDYDIDAKYGFELLNALNDECRSAGYQWSDGGEISPEAWSLIDRKVNQEKLPVIVALNGPEFSPSGKGHIVTIIKTEGNKVYYADPASGKIKTTTKQAMNAAPSHPDGNFIFFATRLTPSTPSPNVLADGSFMY